MSRSLNTECPRQLHRNAAARCPRGTESRRPERAERATLVSGTWPDGGDQYAVAIHRQQRMLLIASLQLRPDRRPPRPQKPNRSMFAESNPCRAPVQLCGALIADLGRRVDPLLPSRKARPLFARIVVGRHRAMRRKELIERPEDVRYYAANGARAVSASSGSGERKRHVRSGGGGSEAPHPAISPPTDISEREEA